MKTSKKVGLSILLILLAFSLFVTLSKAAANTEMSAESEGNVSNISSAIYKMDLKEGYVTLRERDLIEFQWNGKTERIMVREISKDNQSIAITVFIDGAKAPVYTFLGFKNHLNADFNLDREPELSVGLYDIKGKDVTLYLKPIIKEPPIVVKENVTTRLIKGMSIAIGMIILGLVAFLLIKNSKSKKKKR